MRNNGEKCCENCGNLVPIGEGDHICEEAPTQLVLDGYVPTNRTVLLEDIWLRK